MAGNLETNSQGDSAIKEIAVDAIARRINSAKDVVTKVEAARLSLQYLLAKGRPNHALSLLAYIDGPKLPFSEGEQSKILNSILGTADSLLEQDPLEAWSTVGFMMVDKERIGQQRYFSDKDYKQLDQQKFEDQKVRTLGRFIECYLNPEIKIQGREEWLVYHDLRGLIGTIESGSYGPIDLGKVIDSLSEFVREKLLAGDYLPDDIKKKLQESASPRKATTAEISVPAFKATKTEEGNDYDFHYQIEIHGKDTGFKWRVGEKEEGGEVKGYLSNTKRLVDPNKFPDSIVVPSGFAIELEHFNGIRSGIFTIRVRKDTEIPLSRKVGRIWFYKDVPKHILEQSPGEIYQQLMFGDRQPITFDDFKKLLAGTQPTLASTPSAPAPAAAETLRLQVPAEEPKAKVEAIPISGKEDDSNDLFKLKIEGKEPQIIWRQNKGVFDLTEFRQTGGQLMLPNGTRLHIGKYILGEGRSLSLIITGGKSTGISIRDLIYFKDNNNASIVLEINNAGNWSEYEELGLNEKSGKAILDDYSIGSGKAEAEEKITHGLSVKQAIDRLKESLEKAKT